MRSHVPFTRSRKFGKINPMQKVLVTGGAGYIGSITSRLLAENGYIPIVFDNFEKGHTEAVSGFEVVRGDLRDSKQIEEAIAKYQPNAVIHFAAYIEAGESMRDPGRYFENIIGGSLNLFRAMVKEGIDKIVFSSTAAVYGEPKQLPIREEQFGDPVNPYGEAKYIVERLLQWFFDIHQMSSIRLRYFNVAGAWLDGSMGEDHDPETHIIPLIIKTIQGQRDQFTLYGDTYPTPDGTNIRDYIHVVDLGRAHLKALERLDKFKGTEVYNVGVGRGYSNLEIIQEVERVTGQKLPYTVGDRRPGDPAQLYADNQKIVTELGWQPEYGLQEIIESAWRWHSSHPNGYSNHE